MTGMEVDVHSLAAARADGALVVDVREPEEYRQGHVPGARLIPLSELMARAGELPRGQRVHLVCASGNRSLQGARLLVAAGYGAVSVAGGTKAWQDSGQPVITGLDEDAR